MFARCDRCGQDCESARELADHIEARHFNRGRRFFLVGALALPLAKKIELAASGLVPARFPFPVVPNDSEQGQQHVFVTGAPVRRWVITRYSLPTKHDGGRWVASTMDPATMVWTRANRDVFVGAGVSSLLSPATPATSKRGG